jgi:hypothetical protein
MPFRHRWRNEPGRAAFQQILFIQHLHLESDRKPGGEFNYPIVEEGEPAFHRVRHCHPVPLRRQDITGEQVFGLQVLRLAEAVPRCIRLGQPRSDFGVPIVPANLRPDGIGKERLQLGRQLPARKVREEWLQIGVNVDVEERFAVGIRLVLYVLQVRIQAAEQDRPHLGIGPRFPKTADLVFFENVIAAENFIGPFSSYYDLVTAVSHQPREQIQGSRSRSQYRFLGVPDDVGKYLADLILAAPDLLVLGVQKAHRLRLERAFIEFGVVEGNREGAQPGVRKFLDQCRGERRVQPAAQVRANRDIGAQTDLCRVNQKLEEIFGVCRFLGRIDNPRCPLELNIPVRPYGNPVRIHGHRMARRKFVDISEEGCRSNSAPIGENLIQTVDIDFSRDAWKSEDRLDLRAEDKGLVRLGIEERSYA